MQFAKEFIEILLGFSTIFKPNPDLFADNENLAYGSQKIKPSVYGISLQSKIKFKCLIGGNHSLKNKIVSKEID